MPHHITILFQLDDGGAAEDHVLERRCESDSREDAEAFAEELVGSIGGPVTDVRTNIVKIEG